MFTAAFDSLRRDLIFFKESIRNSVHDCLFVAQIPFPHDLSSSLYSKLHKGPSNDQFMLPLGLLHLDVSYRSFYLHSLQSTVASRHCHAPVHGNFYDQD